MATRGAASLDGWRRRAVQRIRAARRALLAFVGRLPEQEVLRPRTLDRWSVKDVLAHLTACDEETVRRLRLIARGRGERIVWFRSMADADRFNARTVAGLRRLGLAAVVRRMERAQAELIARLQALPADALRDPAHEYPVVEWLPAPGWRHVRDHLDEIEGWWRARQTELAPGAGAGRRVSPRERAGGALRRPLPCEATASPKEAIMTVRNPEDMARAWQDALNSGNVEGLLALYEPGATLIPEPGKSVTGHEGIRQALSGFLAMKPRISLRATNIMKTADIALIYGAWTLEGTGPDGKPSRLDGQSTEVLRRQADGGWRYLIDDPFSVRAA